MKHPFRFLILLYIYVVVSVTAAKGQEANYPHTQISNKEVVMKIYLPDPQNGYYRAARFDWSGIIYSLEYDGHQFFGEWKPTHDPKEHDGITGPVESFRGEGMGFEEAKPGEQFMRIGVGMLEKQEDTIYHFSKNYKITDFGKWTFKKGPDWIQFQHRLNSNIGWSYVYTKKIILLKEKPGFIIEHTLKNTGQKTIDSDQFNHNFFVIDADTTGPHFKVEFPFTITETKGLSDPSSAVRIEKQQLSFKKKLSGDYVWMDIKGFGTKLSDHQVRIMNEKMGAGVQIKGDKPLYRLIFWASKKTLSPENYVLLHIEPGKSEHWTSTYTLISEKNGDTFGN
jgi:hypothetical protein